MVNKKAILTGTFFLFLPKLVFMTYRKHLIYILLIPLLIHSCRPARQPAQPSAGEPNAAAYIARYKDLAVSEMKRTGVPASITLAQGMIESDFGRSTLARQANNHFGIKCHKDWTGPTIRHHDDRRNECFRKYSSPEESYYDHSDFLRNGSRYAFLFELDDRDYKGWARGLKKAGYATNPDYANMLIRKIEQNSLQYYDQERPVRRKPEAPAVAVSTERKVLANDTLADNDMTDKREEVTLKPAQRVMENNRVRYIIVQEGETREMIEKEFRLLKWELARYNELREEFVPVAGQILYLQPKRDKAEPGKETHIVGEGETLYSVSQKYAIKRSRMNEMNRIPEGEEPLPGSRLWLRRMKPVN